MKETSSWVKLPRNLIDSQIFQNEKLLKVYIWCLLKASHFDYDQLVGKQIIHLKKGQFVFGRLSASRELNMNDRTFYDYINILKEFGAVQINANNKFSIATINNFEDFTVKKRGSSQYGAGYYKGQEDKEKEMLEILNQTEEQKNIPTQTLESE